MSESESKFLDRMAASIVTDAELLEADLTRLLSLARRGAELEAVLRAWDDAVRIDVKMQGPQYAGVSYKAGRDAWERTRAALTQPVPEKEKDIGLTWWDDTDTYGASC